MNKPPHQLIQAGPVFSQTAGRPDIRIGLIDGPLAMDHPDLEHKHIHLLGGKNQGSCSIAHSVACMHGTQVAGILAAKRNSHSPGICPECTLLIQPIFPEEMGQSTSSDAIALANSIRSVIDAGAHIINLSLGLDIEDTTTNYELIEVLDYAADRQVIIVSAAGNQGTLASTEITRHAWVIPVVAYDRQKRPMSISNLSQSTGRQGIGSPGEQILTLASNGGYTRFSGTSAATPFVTGTIALLWSLFPNRTASQIKSAILYSNGNRRKSIVPPLLNAMAAYQYLKNQAS